MSRRYVVSVSYISSYNGRTYDFWTDIPLTHGDTVVVDAATGLGLAEVMDIKDHSRKANKWVVQKVDLDAYDAKMEREKRMEELLQEMESITTMGRKLALFEEMAKTDIVLDGLLKEYQGLEAQL